jgi:hypothetical protein
MGNRNFTETMEQGRANAVTARNKGYATGKAAKGWNKQAPAPDRETFERAPCLCITERARRFRDVTADFTLECQMAIYPEQYEGGI